MHLRATGLILVSICYLGAAACSDAASTLQPKNDGGSGGGGGAGGAGGNGTGGGSGGAAPPADGPAPHDDAATDAIKPVADAATDTVTPPKTDAPPAQNACVAAGGTCTRGGVSCLQPSNPALDQSCGDPQPAHCCMPPPDGGGPDHPADAPVIGPDGKFACGNKMSCDPATQYCMAAVGGVGGDSYNCQPIPARCAPKATCACVRFGPCPQCTETDGAVLLICPVG